MTDSMSRGVKPTQAAVTLFNSESVNPNDCKLEKKGSSVCVSVCANLPGAEDDDDDIMDDANFSRIYSNLSSIVIEYLLKIYVLPSGDAWL